ncbi:condensation domain-containing protein [Streptomyces cellostaticus]|uniref:condensation domain-containing protein n=1 Tax=Streptomyces cellostaticus TaxID=67285 RepID=UPI0020267166|nr:condensation domain-containing protein [Streptomyces cellostaticus]
MSIIAVAPLTFGQLSLWRSIQDLSADNLSVANLHRVWALPGDCSLTGLESALSHLVERHEALRTKFRRSGPRGIEQEVWAADPVRLEVLEADEDAEQKAAEAARRLAAQPFDLGSEFLWRAVALCRGGQPRYLCLSVHHMAADRVSLGLLHDDLCTLLSGGSFEAPAATPRAVAETQQSEAWAVRRAAAVDHWCKTLQAAPPPVPPAGPHALMFSGVLRSAPALDAAVTFADGLGISLHSAVLAVLCETIAARTGEKRMLIGLMAGNRNDSESRSLVASQNQLVPFLAEVDGKSDADSFARRIHWKTLLAYRHGSFDVDDVEPLAQKYGRHGNGDGFDYIFNFSQTPVGSAVGGSASPESEIEVSSEGRDIGYPLYFQAGTSPDLLWCQLSLRKEAAGVSGKDETRFVQETREFLETFQRILMGKGSAQPI